MAGEEEEEGEEWERPIGLTAEFAILLDDSDDDDDDDEEGDGGGGVCASWHGCRGGGRGTGDVAIAPPVSSSRHHLREEEDAPRWRPLAEAAAAAAAECDVVGAGDDGTERSAAGERRRRRRGGGRGGEEDDIVDDSNPFASFAFEKSEEGAPPLASSSSSSSSWSWSMSSWRRENRPTSSTENHPADIAPVPALRKRSAKRGRDGTTQEEKADNAEKTSAGQRWRTRPPFFSSGTAPPPPGIRDGGEGDGDATIDAAPRDDAEEEARRRMRDGEERRIERRMLVERWHAHADPDAPIETRRFQILVAARLHARCQGPVVRRAMGKLREHFRGGGVDDDGSADDRRASSRSSSSSSGLTVHTLASADPERDIAPLLSSVLFGNAKSKQIVRAARDVLSKFGGSVPESVSGLREITGIGPTLAEILAIVNRRCTFPPEVENVVAQAARA